MNVFQNHCLTKLLSENDSKTQSIKYRLAQMRFSSDYENDDYEYKIRNFRAKFGPVCLRHLTKLVVVGLLTTKLISKLKLDDSKA